MTSVEVLRTDKSWIQKTPNKCGGNACIRDTRITVWGLVEWRKLGLTDAEIRQRVVDVSQADLDAVWQYYEQHREEIERVIRENEEA